MENTGKEETEIQLAYYIEPVLGVNRDNSRHLTARWENGALLMSSPFSPVAGSLILTAFGGAEGCDCDQGPSCQENGAEAPWLLSPTPVPSLSSKDSCRRAAGNALPLCWALPPGTRRQ